MEPHQTDDPSQRQQSLGDQLGRPRFAIVSEEPAGPKQDADLTPSLLEMARAIASICATRILLLLAVLFSGTGLVWTIYDPTTLRIIASTAYAVVVVWPLTALFWRRG